MDKKAVQTQKAIEKLERLAGMELAEWVARDFEENGRLCYSDHGILFGIEANPEFSDIVEEFEKKHDATVYHLMLTRMCGFDLLTLLAVGGEDDWIQELECFKEGYACAWVANLTDRKLSEWGDVGFRVASGGMVRTF